jgi:hypothetical protein
MTDTQTTTPPRPDALPVHPDAIPPLLRETARWVLWRYQLVQRGNGASARQVWAKVPKMANGRNARSTDPASWTTYERALDVYLRRVATLRFDGLGFIFDGSDGLLGIDLDDCVTQDVLGGYELNDLARDTIAELPGYWEISPSGTGVKGWVRAPGIGAQKNDALGIEVYDAGRYFTVTGHEISCSYEPGWPEISERVHAWVLRHLGNVAPKQQVAVASATGDDALDAFNELNNTPQPLNDWTIERVRAEIAPYLDIESHYEDWVKVGMILHHQFEGSDDGLELWQSIYRDGSKFDEATGDEKWASFGKRRAKGTVATLATLVKQTRAAREKAAPTAPLVPTAAEVDERAEVQTRLQGYLDQIQGTTDAHNLETFARERVAKDKDLGDTDLAQVAQALVTQAKLLNIKLPIATARKWLRRSFNGAFPDVSADGQALDTQGNLAALCEQLGVEIRYDVIAKRDEILIPNANWSIDNRDVASLMQLYSECRKAQLNTTTGTLKNYVTMMGDLNPWNPPLNWVRSKPWDGVDRIQPLVDTIVSPMDTELKKTLMTHWLVSAVVALVSTEGVMARGVLVFQGAQYQGKTRWLESLAPKALIGEQVVRSGVMLDMRNKDSVKQAVSYWLVELGELEATFSRSEIGALKAFLSSHTDVLRKPYAPSESTFSRRTVFFATVNDHEFLHDRTGNTRFWVIPVDFINPDHGIDVQQLWAQVLVLQEAGALHYPTNETIARLNEHNTDFEAEDPLIAKLRETFAWGDPMAELSWLSSSEILAAMGLNKPTKGDAMRVSHGVREIAGRTAVKRSHGRRLFCVPVKDGSLL